MAIGAFVALLAVVACTVAQGDGAATALITGEAQGVRELQTKLHEKETLINERDDKLGAVRRISTEGRQSLKNELERETVCVSDKDGVCLGEGMGGQETYDAGTVNPVAIALTVVALSHCRTRSG